MSSEASPSSNQVYLDELNSLFRQSIVLPSGEVPSVLLPPQTAGGPTIASSGTNINSQSPAAQEQPAIRRPRAEIPLGSGDNVPDPGTSPSGAAVPKGGTELPRRRRTAAEEREKQLLEDFDTFLKAHNASLGTLLTVVFDEASLELGGPQHVALVTNFLHPRTRRGVLPGSPAGDIMQRIHDHSLNIPGMKSTAHRHNRAQSLGSPILLNIASPGADASSISPGAPVRVTRLPASNSASVALDRWALKQTVEMIIREQAKRAVAKLNFIGPAKEWTTEMFRGFSLAEETRLARPTALFQVLAAATKKTISDAAGAQSPAGNDLVSRIRQDTD